MFESRPAPASEFLGSRTEAPLLTPDTNIDLHRSSLGSAEEGRLEARAARALIDAELNRDGPPPLLPQGQLALYGAHLADFRAWAGELNEEQSESARTFREVGTEFERRASQADRYPRSDTPFSRQSSDPGMLSYEATIRS
jgi:hypothetical protein